MALSREITLTIDDYNITLDKEIKIYEYDAINLCFTIQEYGIVMRDGKAHNRVMPVVALRAYMLIETPQGTDSVEATNIVRNKIMFSLGNKYSRFVGNGKMQIILKDFDGCRITLPEFTYEVKQSINTGWDDGSFDVLITEKEDTIITDELGRPVETTKISEMDEVNEVTPQTYTMVINEDGNKKINLDTIMKSVELDVEEIDRIIDEMIEVYDDEEIEVEFPSLHNDVEKIKGEINEISESLDNIENEKATKQEVDVERKRIDNINSSLDTKANKSEVDNNINELDVKIAENKTLTDSEIAKIKEIANTWTQFKNNGGTINGNVNIVGDNKKLVLSDSSLSNLWEQYPYPNGNGVLYKKNDIMQYQMTATDFSPGKFNDNKTLGTSERYWQDIYLGYPSINSNGYTKLPNGLIMQWGKILLSGGSDGGKWQYVGYPISFPTSTLNVQLTQYGGDDYYTAKVAYYENGGFMLHGMKERDYNWIAIGY